MSAGHGGQILLSQEAKDLMERSLPAGVRVKDMGEHRLKGLSIPSISTSGRAWPGDRFPSSSYFYPATAYSSLDHQALHSPLRQELVSRRA